MNSLCDDKDAYPLPEWCNTSSNSIIKELVYQADSFLKEEIEQLMLGKTIETPIHEEITYEDIHASADNLWNFLLFTGYLKVDSVRMEEREQLVNMSIPNEEILYIYENTITNWFRDEIRVKDLTPLYQAMLDGEEADFQKELNEQLQATISYMDSKEAFYHGFLMGLLANLDGYKVK